MTAERGPVRVLFMGTPDIAAECLRQLIACPDADVVGADAPLAWFGVGGGYKTNNKYFSFDELAVSTILEDVVPVPGAGPPKPVFRAAADGGALALDGGSLSLNLVACEADCWYAPFTNATVAGPFFAERDGVHPAADGTLSFSVDAGGSAKFVVVGASLEPIHEGDAVVPSSAGAPFQP